LIYLDHAAATPVRPEVLAVMLPFFSEKFTNPSSVYSLARQNSNDLEEARDTVAKILNLDSSQITFTSGGTESCNLAVKGISLASGKKHIITSKIEHSAVLNSCKSLEKNGFRVDYLSVNPDGFIDLEELKSKISRETALVSVIYANNEIGTIQPIQEIHDICQKHDVPFHIDACQAAGYLDLQNLPANAITLNASKINGPKGAGLLSLSPEIPFDPQLHGGEQENGIRPGTENLPAIVGFAKALELSSNEHKQESTRISEMQGQLLDLLLAITGVTLNGSRENRLPNNINISIDGIEGESAVIRLDQKGLMCSTGSACSSKKVDPSHVLLAINPNRGNAHSSLRITLGKSNSIDQIPIIFETIKQVITELRRFSDLS
jgi:cysteine desulfurase